MSRMQALRTWEGNALGTFDALRSGPPGVDVLRALQRVDFVLLPHEVDMAGPRALADRFRARSAADDLRLPPPPVIARSGAELTAAVAEVARAFEQQPMMSRDREALEITARLCSLLKGLVHIQREIQDRVAVQRV